MTEQRRQAAKSGQRKGVKKKKPARPLKRAISAVVIRIETIKKRLLDAGAMSCREIAAQLDFSTCASPNMQRLVPSLWPNMPPNILQRLDQETIDHIRGRTKSGRKYLIESTLD